MKQVAVAKAAQRTVMTTSQVLFLQATKKTAKYTEENATFCLPIA
jgi:hypothetical protein